MSMVDVVPERAVIYYLLCQSDDAPLVNEKHTYDAQGWSGAGSYLYGNRADSGQTCFMTSTCALALATRRPASRRSDVCPWRPAYDRCVHAWQDAHVVHVLRGTQAAMPGRAGRQAHGGAGAPREHARSGGVVGRPLRVATALGGAARRRRTTVRAPPPRRRRPRASAAASPMAAATASGPARRSQGLSSSRGQPRSNGSARNRLGSPLYTTSVEAPGGEWSMWGRSVGLSAARGDALYAWSERGLVGAPDRIRPQVKAGRGGWLVQGRGG